MASTMVTVEDQALEALGILHNGGNNEIKKQADEFLISFQQTPAAWKFCSNVLLQDNSAPAFVFFAAQTLRTKVQFDYHELQNDGEILRDQILTHLEKLMNVPRQPAQIQLSLALADLAIQMDGLWPDPVGDLLKRWSQHVQSLPSLLDVLALFPEEQQNNSLMTDSEKRRAAKERLGAASPIVISFLLGLTLSEDSSLPYRVLKCLKSWLSVGSLKDKTPAIVQARLVEECVRRVVCQEEAELATEILEDLLHESNSLEEIEPVLLILFSAFPKLQAGVSHILRDVPRALRTHSEMLGHIARIFTEVAFRLLPVIATDSVRGHVTVILDVLLHLTMLPSHDADARKIVTIPLHFWEVLANKLGRHPELNRKNQFHHVFLFLWEVLLQGCRLPAEQSPYELEDDLLDHRRDLLAVCKRCLPVLKTKPAVARLLQGFASLEANDIVGFEATLFVLQVAAAKVQVEDRSGLWEVLNKVVEFLAKQQQDSETQLSPVQSAQVVFTKMTAVALVETLWSWAESNLQLLHSTVRALWHILLGPVPLRDDKETRRAHQLLAAAANCFKFLASCEGARSKLAPLLSPMMQMCLSTMHLPVSTHLDIVFPVALVLSGPDVPDHDLQVGLHLLVQPLVQRFDAALEARDPSTAAEALDRITFVIRALRVEASSAKAKIIGEGLVSSVYDRVVCKSMQAFPQHGEVVEKSLRVLKHSMKCVSSSFKPCVERVAQSLVHCFPLHQHSTFLYTAEIIADVYCGDADIRSTLVLLFEGLSSAGLQVLGRVEALDEMCDLFEDFYGMIDRYFRCVPSIVVQAPALAPALELATRAIFINMKKASQTIFNVLSDVLEHIALRRGPLEDQARLHAIMSVVAPVLLRQIFRLLVAIPTRDTLEMLPDIVCDIRSAFPAEFCGWLAAGLEELPIPVASPREREVLRSFLLAADMAQMERLLVELAYKCKQLALRGKK